MLLIIENYDILIFTGCFVIFNVAQIEPIKNKIMIIRLSSHVTDILSDQYVFPAIKLINFRTLSKK
jgi:hypothetical protein